LRRSAAGRLAIPTRAVPRRARSATTRVGLGLFTAIRHVTPEAS